MQSAFGIPLMTIDEESAHAEVEDEEEEETEEDADSMQKEIVRFYLLPGSQEHKYLYLSG